MFSASLTFFLITWRRHLLSKNSQSSVRGDQVGKCTVRSACFLVPEAGGMHLTKNSGNFGPKLDWPRSIQPKIRPVGSGKVVHLKRWTSFFEAFPVGPIHWVLDRNFRKFWPFITSGAPLIVFDISRGLYLSETDYRRFRPKGLSTYSLFSA